MTRPEDEVIAFEDPPVRPPRSRSLAAWSDADDHERVLLAGLLLLAAGCALVALPLAFIVPGVIITAVALGFTLNRSPR